MNLVTSIKPYSKLTIRELRLAVGDDATITHGSNGYRVERNGAAFVVGTTLKSAAAGILSMAGSLSSKPTAIDARRRIAATLDVTPSRFGGAADPSALAAVA